MCAEQHVLIESKGLNPRVAHTWPHMYASQTSRCDLSHPVFMAIDPTARAELFRECVVSPT